MVAIVMELKLYDRFYNEEMLLLDVKISEVFVVGFYGTRNSSDILSSKTS